MATLMKYQQEGHVASVAGANLAALASLLSALGVSPLADVAAVTFYRKQDGTVAMNVLKDVEATPENFPAGSQVISKRTV